MHNTINGSQRIIARTRRELLYLDETVRMLFACSSFDKDGRYIVQRGGGRYKLAKTLKLRIRWAADGAGTEEQEE